jgi:phosphotransferase system HPr (HPr) family protein
MKQLLLQVTHEVGLHARPAAMFVQCAKASQSTIKVRNASKGSKWVDAKSILGILTLGVQRDDQIEVTIEGSDEEVTMQSIARLVKSDFSESEQNSQST